MAELLSQVDATKSALGGLLLLTAYVVGAALKKWGRGGDQVQADSFSLIDRLEKQAETASADAHRERERANRWQGRYYREHGRRVRREDYAYTLESQHDVVHRVWNDEDDDQDEGDAP